MPERVNIRGWKGRDDIEITEEGGMILIIEHRQHKESGEVYENRNYLPKENVDIMLKIIKDNCRPLVPYGYQYLVRKVIEYYGIDKETGVPTDYLLDAFNGGKNRAKYYFPLLYYPLKVLEDRKKIIYLGRGGIIWQG